MTLLEKVYQPQSIEQNWYQTWEQNGYFKPSGIGSPYCVMLPPPNVTGSLHMGHGFGFTLIDILIRYQRMSGKNTLWQAGTDHAGIATQMVVERKLQSENQSRHDLGRDLFIEKIWEWKQESGDHITRQLRRMGASIDWSRERFTLDEELSFAVREVFIRLFEEGLIYKGKRLVNWDPVLLTAISDLEVNNQEEEGKLWYLRYPFAGQQTMDGKNYLVIATTRPETLLGDVAVAVHPDDSRYQHLIGQSVQLPLTNKIIPIIADDYVEQTLGTGCVKITPAHDFNDYAIGQRHHLEAINIFTETAHLNENVPKQYQGLERFAAREKILADLEAENLLEKSEKHLAKIPRGDRSNAIIEPYLTYQWYVKSKPLAEQAIEVVQNGQVSFIPENWQKTYFQWMNNIEDWCISRQLWWGHRIPVWYDQEGKAYVGHDEKDVRKRYQLNENIILEQDEDVLDTWFSSALWPFSTLGWPKKTEDFNVFFPTSVLITGFDIIFFWVARMIMMSLKFTGFVPFRGVYITGLIRDSEGQKMSKSKGNVLDPIDLIDGISLENLIQKRTSSLMQPAMAAKIEKNTRKEFPEGIPSYGTDALRFTFCSFASYTREIRFDVNRLAGYRNFCNKLWNASRYVLMNCGEFKTTLTLSELPLSLADRWIISLVQKTIAEAHQAYQNYRFDLLAQTLYDFTWNEFCDWYLELSKPILNNPDSKESNLDATRYTLLYVLEAILRLLHPIIPFITEEIWQQIAPLLNLSGKTIMLEQYPQSVDNLIDAESEAKLNWLKEVIVAIRVVRSEMNIAPGKLLPILLRSQSDQDQRYIRDTQPLLMTLARLESINWLSAQETPPPSATTFANQLEIFIPMAGFIDVKEESKRLQKEVVKIEKELLFIQTKLANPQFIDKAPEPVINKERAKHLELTIILAKLQEQLEKISRM